MRSPKIAPPIMPIAVAAALPEPRPMLFPITPPAIAPTADPAPDLGWVTTAWLFPQTCWFSVTN